jgi:segregation and condensation protein A
MQEKIFDLLVNNDDIQWQTILYDLVKTEQMDPWDVDISTLTQKYIEIIKKLKEANLTLSGKVLLASAILLKIKSNQFMSVDMLALDQLIKGPEDVYDEYEDLGEVGIYDIEAARRRIASGDYRLIPKTPQPRKRKVSIYDLVNALEKAMEVRKRRILRTIPAYEKQLELPKRGMDIGKAIKEVYLRIGDYFKQNKGQKLTFTMLLANQDKQEKIRTFMPLLYLTNQRRIDMEQQEHFGEIEIKLMTKKVEEAKT